MCCLIFPFWTTHHIEGTMAGQIFKRLFPGRQKPPETVSDVDKTIRDSGRTINVRYVHRDVCSSRGSVFSIESRNADEIFDKALEK